MDAKFSADAERVLEQLVEFVSLFATLFRAIQLVASANGGDVSKARGAVSDHLTPGSVNAPALAPDVKV